jgi:cytochrome c oxidase assembly protein subunit 15
MTSFLRSDRSTPVAVWLWLTALVVFALVVVGGVTRLTDSGLSITQWKPISGALPPLSHQAWLDEFALYQRIPQYRLVNPDMTVESFKSIYWWEWSHRLLGRAVGVVFAAPFAVFLVRRQLPRRLILPCCAMLALGGLQGLVGWWMVSSGLSERVSVAPERLAIHLGLALLLFVSLIWTGCSAFSGQPRQSAIGPWKRWSLVFLGSVYLQCLLGALVAGNDAGLIYNDWPLFNGAWWPQTYFGGGLWATLAHSQGAVQAHHRLLAYAIFAAGLAVGAVGWRSRVVDRDIKTIAAAIAGAVTVQAALGVATLMASVPVWLGALHQAGGAGLLALATVLAWRVRRV